MNKMREMINAALLLEMSAGRFEVPNEVFNLIRRVSSKPGEWQREASEILPYLRRGPEALNFAPSTPPDMR